MEVEASKKNKKVRMKGKTTKVNVKRNVSREYNKIKNMRAKQTTKYRFVIT